MGYFGSFYHLYVFPYELIKFLEDDLGLLQGSWIGVCRELGFSRTAPKAIVRGIESLYMIEWDTTVHTSSVRGRMIRRTTQICPQRPKLDCFALSKEIPQSYLIVVVYCS